MFPTNSNIIVDNWKSIFIQMRYYIKPQTIHNFSFITQCLIDDREVFPIYIFLSPSLSTYHIITSKYLQIQ